MPINLDRLNVRALLAFGVTLSNLVYRCKVRNAEFLVFDEESLSDVVSMCQEETVILHIP